MGKRTKNPDYNKENPPPQKTPLKEKLRKVEPLTDNQAKTFAAFAEGSNLLLHGMAGTGKTFLSMYLAMQEFQCGRYQKIIIIRSAVPSRDMGFLPGDPVEKALQYETPYMEIMSELYNRSDAYKLFKDKGVLDFLTTSFLRGRTFHNAIVIVDEIQNMSFQELDTVMTRAGKNSRWIFAGDMIQSDFLFDREKKGLDKFMRILQRMTTNFTWVEFSIDDIVRDGIVKDYIQTREMLRELDIALSPKE